MNIIFAKHDGCETQFCFSVPASMSEHISKGDLLLVKTSKGIEIATATTGVVSGAGAEDVAVQNGAYYPIKPVISFVNDEMKKYIAREVCNQITECMASVPDNLCCGDLPF